MKNHNITDAVYVGDTQGDLDAAELAGMPFIYCAFGFGQVMADDRGNFSPLSHFLN